MEMPVKHPRLASLTLLAFATLLLAPAASAGPGHVNFTFGQKLFDGDEFPDGWDPIDKQTAFGAEAAFGPGAWPVQIAAYLGRASKEKNAELPDGVGGTVPGTLDATTTEFGLGLNKTLGEKKIRPYVGAGVVYAKTDITLRETGASFSDDANGFGFWGGAGAFYRIGTSFNFGAGARYSNVTVDYDAYSGTTIAYPAFDLDAGGTQVHVLIGWSWPKLAP